MTSDLSRIEFLLDADRHADALRLIAPAIASDPDNPMLWSGAARAHLGEKNWQEGLDAAGRVVVLMPHDGLGHLYASIALSGMGRAEEALNAALQGVALNPSHPTYHVQVAECASVLKPRRDLAWSAANRAVELAPLDAESHAGMGLVALRQGRLDVAQKALRRALELDPTNHRAQHNLGIVRMQEGEMAAAARDLHVSAAADPTSPLSERAFHILILRILQRMHWGLWVVWLLVRINNDNDPGPSIGIIAFLLVGFSALGAALVHMLDGVNAQLRRVLWQVLRRSATATAWLVCVLLGIGFLVAAAAVPSPELRSSCISSAGWALVIGCLASWLDVGIRRHHKR